MICSELQNIRPWLVCFSCGFLILVCSLDSRAQDIEPRVMTAAPVGTNIFGLSVSHSWGAVLLDKTLPVEDLDGYTTSLVPSFSRYLNIFNWTGRFDAILPIARGEWDAFVGDSDLETNVRRSGLGDPRLSLVLFLVGAQAMTPEQFSDYQKKTIVGFSLRVSIPLGQYDKNRLLNLGSNRWQIVPGLALSHRMGRWTGEFYTAVWFFTDNQSFLGENVLEQDPLYAFQINIAYDFKPGLWLAIGMRQTFLGKTTLNGEHNNDPTRNNRIGLVFGFPIGRHHTLKLIATTGTTATKGNNFNTLVVQWFIN